MDFALAAVRLLIDAQPAKVALSPKDLELPVSKLLGVDHYLKLALERRPELRAVHAGIDRGARSREC